MSYDMLLYIVITLIVVPVLGAAANTLESYTRPKSPRLADFLAAIFPHIQDAARAAAPKPKLPPMPGDPR